MRRTTVPRLPLSRPDSTTTSSPFLMRCICAFSVCVLLQHLGCQGYDLHEALGTQLARHRPEDTGADRLELRREQHRRIAVEADERAVGAAHALGGAHHDRVVDLALLHTAARRGLLHADLDEVADGRIAPLRAAHDLDALDGARAGVVGDVQYGLHLNHCGSPLSNLRRLTKSGVVLDPGSSSRQHRLVFEGPGFYTAFDFSTRR